MPERRCYQVECEKYPECANSAGSCCAIEMEEEFEIKAGECFERPEKPLYVPRKIKKRYG